MRMMLVCAALSLLFWLEDRDSLAGNTVPLLADTEFRQGFSISGLDTRSGPKELGRLVTGEAHETPVWRLSQWFSRLSLESSAATAREYPMTFSNEVKKIELSKDKEGRPNLLLEANAIAEYLGRTRQKGEAWPHLLIDQGIGAKLRIVDMEKLEFRIDAKLTTCVRAEGVDPRIGKAQIGAHVTVQNRNPNSPGRGDYFWFGVPIFDSHFEIPKGLRQKDSGKADATGKFIYYPDGKVFWSSGLADGEWHGVRADLLPHILDGLRFAQESGFLRETKLEDLALGSFNLGWEMTASYDAGLMIRNLVLEARLKPPAITKADSERP